MFKLPEEECCAECGTDLNWWRKQSKENKVFRTPDDSYYCTKKCMFDSVFYEELEATNG